MSGFGYREVAAYLRGEYGREEAVARYQQATRYYARRQESWFRPDRRIHWLDAGGVTPRRCSDCGKRTHEPPPSPSSSTRAPGTTGSWSWRPGPAARPVGAEMGWGPWRPASASATRGGGGRVAGGPGPRAPGALRMRMYNPDGSEAEMCGNGLRCFGRWLLDRGEAGPGPLAVQTGAGVLALELGPDGRGGDRHGASSPGPGGHPLSEGASAGQPPGGRCSACPWRCPRSRAGPARGHLRFHGQPPCGSVCS